MTTAMVEQQTKNEQKQDLKLEIRRVIRASRQQVFDAWTRPATIRLWFWTGTGESAIDLNRNSAVTGRYTRIEPHNALAFMWKGGWNSEEESLVTITLRDVEGGTELTLVQDRFVTEISYAKHVRGWMDALDKLRSLVEKE